MWSFNISGYISVNTQEQNGLKLKSFSSWNCQMVISVLTSWLINGFTQKTQNICRNVRRKSPCRGVCQIHSSAVYKLEQLTDQFSTWTTSPTWQHMLLQNLYIQYIVLMMTSQMCCLSVLPHALMYFHTQLFHQLFSISQLLVFCFHGHIKLKMT